MTEEDLEKIRESLKKCSIFDDVAVDARRLLDEVVRLREKLRCAEGDVENALDQIGHLKKELSESGSEE